MALGLLSRRVSRRDLWPRLITLLLLYFMLLYSLLLLQDGGFQKMLVFDRTRFSCLFWHFCSSVHIQPISLIPMHMYRSSLLASTLDEYSRLLCSPFSPVL